MKLIDLSQPVYDRCPNCPEHPYVKSEIIATHEKHGWRLEKLTLASHTGSHVDAPLHKLAGAASLDEIPLEKWVGSAWIADLRDAKAGERFGVSRLAASLRGDLADRIALLATSWGDRRAMSEEWLSRAPLLTVEGAQWLVDRGVRGVGIDYYSVGDAATHEVLLGAGIWIVEDLKFPAEVFQLPQPVQFWCLPMNLKGHTGAFCRPVVVAS